MAVYKIDHARRTKSLELLADAPLMSPPLSMMTIVCNEGSVSKSCRSIFGNAAIQWGDKMELRLCEQRRILPRVYWKIKKSIACEL